MPSGGTIVATQTWQPSVPSSCFGYGAAINRNLGKKDGTASNHPPWRPVLPMDCCRKREHISCRMSVCVCRCIAKVGFKRAQVLPIAWVLG